MLVVEMEIIQEGPNFPRILPGPVLALFIYKNKHTHIRVEVYVVGKMHYRIYRTTFENNFIRNLGFLFLFFSYNKCYLLF